MGSTIKGSIGHISDHFVVHKEIRSSEITDIDFVSTRKKLKVQRSFHSLNFTIFPGGMRTKENLYFTFAVLKFSNLKFRTKSLTSNVVKAGFS